MIWDVDSYIIMGEEAKPFSSTGVDLIPSDWVLDKLNAKYAKRLAFQREYRRRKRLSGPQG